MFRSKVELEGKLATFIALHYQVVVSVLDLIERTSRIQVVHLIDESCPEALFTFKSDSLDRINYLALSGVFETLANGAVRLTHLNPDLILNSI